RLDVAIDLAALGELPQGSDVVAEPGRLLELEVGGGLTLLAFHARQELLLLAFQHHAEGADLAAVVLLADAEVARGGALADGGEQTGAGPAPAVVVLGDVQGAGAELEDALQNLHGVAERAGAGERPVELDALAARLAGELDAGEVLADADLQIREGLVVLQLDVETRLDVLDQPGLHQQ